MHHYILSLVLLVFVLLPSLLPYAFSFKYFLSLHLPLFSVLPFPLCCPFPSSSPSSSHLSFIHNFLLSSFLSALFSSHTFLLSTLTSISPFSFLHLRSPSLLRPLLPYPFLWFSLGIGGRVFMNKKEAPRNARSTVCDLGKASVKYRDTLFGAETWTCLFIMLRCFVMLICLAVAWKGSSSHGEAKGKLSLCIASVFQYLSGSQIYNYGVILGQAQR